MKTKSGQLSIEEKTQIRNDLIEGKSQASIAKELGRSESTITRFAANERKRKEITSKELFSGNLDEFSAQDAIQLSLKASIRLLQEAMKDAEDGYVVADENGRQIPLKTLMDCIEKAVKSFTQLEAKKKSTGKNLNIDYKEMAKLYTNSKRSGTYYDSKQHIKDLLNLAHGKIKGG